MIRQSLTAYGRPLVKTTAPAPSLSGSEVLLRIHGCGVCHSDVHLQDGHFDLGEGKQLDIRSGRALPFTLGHEISGSIEDAGPEAGTLDRAALYAAYPWIGCGACSRCASGAEHLCDRPRHLGITVDGGYASHVVVPHPRYLIDVTGIEAGIAGSYMCSGLTAYSAIRKAMRFLRPGGTLMIVGLGGLGLMGLEIAKAVTDATIIAADLAPEKREAAIVRGAAACFDPLGDGARKAVLSSVGAADAAIDFVGSELSLTFGQSIVGKGGAVIVVGLMGGRFNLPVPMFPLRELGILGSYVGTLAEARELIGLARQGRIKPIPYALRPLAEANAALDDLRAGRIVGRTVLRPDVDGTVIPAKAGIHSTM
jgi:D-arabinose 1-dehydrogenase-like Zn-dependent alcohol dehydrogenase